MPKRRQISHLIVQYPEYRKYWHLFRYSGNIDASEISDIVEKTIRNSVMSDQRISLGRQLAKRRQELGWTIRDLARRIGRQPSRVSETETGKANSSIDSLADMASVMRMRIMLVPEEHVDGVMSLISPSASGAHPYPSTTPPLSVFDELFIEDPRESDDHS